jgi:hypothetical protein
VQSFPTLLVIMIVAVIAAVVGLHLVRLRVPHHVRAENNEVAGFFLAVLGVIYAVLLAFVVVAAWEDFRDTTRVVEREANELVDLYRVSQALPEPIGSTVRRLATDYARLAIDVEWPALARGEQTEEQGRVLDEIFRVVTASPGAEAAEDVIRAQFLEHFSALGDARQSRQLAAEESLPWVIWLLLIGGAVMTVVFTYFFSAPNPTAQYIMTALYAGSIVLVLGLISLLDFPLRGDLTIHPHAFDLAIRTFAGQQAP